MKITTHDLNHDLIFLSIVFATVDSQCLEYLGCTHNFTLGVEFFDNGAGGFFKTILSLVSSLVD